MTKEYLERLTELMKQVAPRRYRGIKLEIKHFFSGAAVYANGEICITLTPVGFAIKLPEESRNTLMKQKGVKHLKYFPKGHIKREYAVLSKKLLNDKHRLKKLVDESIKYTISLTNKN